MRTTHVLLCHTDPFHEVLQGRKTHEWRQDDRTPPFKVGDHLHLLEYDPVLQMKTGIGMIVKVTYISRGPAFGVPEGYCVMSVRRVKSARDRGVLIDPVLLSAHTDAVITLATTKKAG